RSDPHPETSEVERLGIVIRNLEGLLGETAPDVAALRLWKQLVSGQRPTEHFSGQLPLFNAGFQAFIEASATVDAAPARSLDRIALALDANSPWTLWRLDQTSWNHWGSHNDETGLTILEVESASIGRLKAIEELWSKDGFAIETRQDGESRKLRATR